MISWLFLSVLLGEPVDATDNLKGLIALAEYGVLLFLRSAVNALVSDDGSFSVLQGT